MSSPAAPIPLDRPQGTTGPPSVGRAVLFAATLGLFLVWSNTFLAFEVLLAPATGAAPLTWLDLTVARFVPATILCAVWCFGFRRRESMEILRRHPVRLAVAGLLVGPGYGGFMYWGIAQRVSGPVASLLTTCTPLYLTLLGPLLLCERIGRRQAAGLLLGFTGILVVATARTNEGVRPWDVGVMALAHLCWSIYTVLTKPVTRTSSPLVWTYLVIVAGGLFLAPLLPFHGGRAMAALDARGWALLLYLSVVATILGNAMWTWLLRHLPASAVGLTIFLNPPLTTASKWVLAAFFPLTFAFTIRPQEWLGGALALTGVAIALLSRNGGVAARATAESARELPEAP
jgi:O-acetylserine/cysteine efflux transporter